MISIWQNRVSCMQVMFTLSGSTITTSDSDILHLSISLFKKSSYLLHVDFWPHDEELRYLESNIILFNYLTIAVPEIQLSSAILSGNQRLRLTFPCPRVQLFEVDPRDFGGDVVINHPWRRWCDKVMFRQSKLDISYKYTDNVCWICYTFLLILKQRDALSKYFRFIN